MIRKRMVFICSRSNISHDWESLCDHLKKKKTSLWPLLTLESQLWLWNLKIEMSICVICNCQLDKTIPKSKSQILSVELEVPTVATYIICKKSLLEIQISYVSGSNKLNREWCIVTKHVAWQLTIESIMKHLDVTPFPIQKHDLTSQPSD